MVANATGCSSIYSGNLPVTPWTKNKDGQGPVWSNSLFEDNAEFGLGFRLAADKQLETAQSLLKELSVDVGEELVSSILTAPQIHESELRAQRERVAELKVKLLAMPKNEPAEHLLSVVDQFVRRSVWIVGGDGWAYDIGYGGLDHVLASARTSTSWSWTPRSIPIPVARPRRRRRLVPSRNSRRPANGPTARDMALQAISYGNVYVAQVALGANPQQTLQAFREAEAYPGVSLILAYSHCISHGIDMKTGLSQQNKAVASGYWPLLRYDPELKDLGRPPFMLDSPRPTIKFKDYAYNELRYRALAASRPEEAAMLLAEAQRAILEKYHTYEDFAQMDAGPDASRAMGSAGKA